jgi:hypothetical protein
MNYILTQTYNDKGFLTQINYYRSTDETGQPTDLAKQELYSYNFSTNGIPDEEIVTEKILKGDEVVQEQTNNKKLQIQEGMNLNEQARKRLIFQAQTYVLTELTTEQGEAGYQIALDYLEQQTENRTKYINGVKVPLLESINNGTEPWLTLNRKIALTQILE